MFRNIRMASNLSGHQIRPTFSYCLNLEHYENFNVTLFFRPLIFLDLMRSSFILYETFYIHIKNKSNVANS